MENTKKQQTLRKNALSRLTFAENASTMILDFYAEGARIMKKIAKIVGKALLALLLALVTLLLILIFPAPPLLELGSNGPESAKRYHLLLGSLYRSQDMTVDELHCYFSARTTLMQTDAENRKVLLRNKDAIPQTLRETYGAAHIGGISYYNGKIYAGLEDSKRWQHPLVAVYDAKTLAFSGECYELDKTIHSRGLPWVAVDPETGLLWAMDHSVTPTAMYAYDVNNAMQPAGSVTLSESVHRVQGGEFFGGMFYGATQDDTQAVYRVNPKTGEVKKMFDRNLAPKSEGEGMTLRVEKQADGSEAPVFYAMDLGPLFVNAYVREYRDVAGVEQ